MRHIAAIGFVIAAMIGLYLHIEYSGWVLFFGILIAL